MNNKVIGVIANNIENFLVWKLENNFTCETNKNINITRKFSHNGILYIALTKKENVHGYIFDEIIELDGARYNKDYDKILEYIKPCMKKQLPSLKIIKGKLKYISIFNPIEILTNDGTLDLRNDIFNVFTNLNDKPTTMNDGRNYIEIVANQNSEYHMEFKKDDAKDTILMILSKKPDFGFSNLGAYLPNKLQNLNGMQIIVTITDESIKIENDPAEQVYELYYTDNNSCHIPDDKVKEICKIGEEDCCIFCTVSGKGFECQKFDSFTSRMLLDRYSKGNMNATRIGNCKIVGRKES
jgi:hypothetical protein